MGAQAPKVPKAPNYAKLYGQGIQTQLQYLPQMLAAEQAARTSQDPLRIQQQQALQQQYGPAQYQQQLDALHTLDPQSAQIRGQLGSMISNDLSSGYSLPEGYATELRNAIRGAQSARGNILGSGAAADEAGFLGQAALQLYQQRLQNAGNFLASPTPEQQLLAVQGVNPDRSYQYFNPQSGNNAAQFGLSNYQNLLAQQAASGAGQNPWSSALGGAASGALAGSSFGPYGAVAGGLIGGVGGYFSTERLKKDIRHIGTFDGIERVEFRYKGGQTWYRGVIAEQAQKVRPDAVFSEHGLLKVDYTKLGQRFEKQCVECKEFKDINDFQKRPNRESYDGHRNACHTCYNTGLGNFKDNPAALVNAADYLLPRVAKEAV
jgi:hypothetical protein